MLIYKLGYHEKKVYIYLSFTLFAQGIFYKGT